MTMNHSLYDRAPVFDALLFDMDGTLVDSRSAVERTWRYWTTQHGLDFQAVVSAAQGRRTRDTVELFCPPGVNALQEADNLERRELADKGGIMPIEGAEALLAALPATRWAVVTSAGKALAHHRLGEAGLPIPQVLITAEMVSRGKPSPEGFLRAARQLRVDAARCLVFEDAPAGIAAARAAKATVIAITGAHAQHQSLDALSIPNFTCMCAESTPDGIRIAGLPI